MSTFPRVTARGLSLSFPGSPPLFTDLGFVLEPSGVYALVGPSGSGKSTILSVLAGWLEPTQGELVREGIDSVAWVFQNPHGVSRRSARDHVALPLLAQGYTHREARAEADDRLRGVGLGGLGERPFQALSGGEAQRLMLARGMAKRPSLFLIDEPTAQLDYTTADSVNAVISALANTSTIIVVATHDTRTRDVCTDVIDLANSQ